MAVDYWQLRKVRDKIEDAGKPFTLPAYPEWVFYVRPLTGYNEHYAREMVRIAQQPGVAEYLKRVNVAGYVPTPEQAAEDEQIDADMLLEAFAGGALAKWEGVTKDGEPLTFNIENAIELLRHFKRDLYPALRLFAKTAANFEELDASKKLESISGNLKRTSPSRSANTEVRSPRSPRQKVGTA